MNAVAVVLVAILGYSTCSPQGRYRPVPNASPGQIIRIISQTQDGPNVDGSYQWSYESENGIRAQERGQVKGQGPEGGIMDAQGDFSYTAPDGTPIALQYVANEGGFQPQGAHLPTAPPIPEAIQRALAYNAAHPEEDDGGQPRGFRRQ
ncbi:endocuticle structural glycoprotein SgAbd-4-like [Aethina tumida]|uniref:endocuticle structural glycoprotein SgAbd-4-like n=1 Tax=Aethina tumida TaxID=116153 RepID=UPI00214777B2|nr:endocuticle structural glycoprotein SgAbd-4-like [Aethina tumida]